MRHAIITLALICATVLGGEDSNRAKDVEVTRKLLLTGARINSELTRAQWLKARFVEVGGNTNTIIVDFHGSANSNIKTLIAVITACVDWTTPKEQDQWHAVKAEATFDAVFLIATNSLGDPLSSADISKWSLISLKIDNTTNK